MELGHIVPSPTPTGLCYISQGIWNITIELAGYILDDFCTCIYEYSVLDANKYIFRNGMLLNGYKREFYTLSIQIMKKSVRLVLDWSVTIVTPQAVFINSHHMARHHTVPLSKGPDWWNRRGEE